MKETTLLDYVCRTYIDSCQEIDDNNKKIWSGEEVSQLENDLAEIARNRARRIETVMNGWLYDLHKQYRKKYPNTGRRKPYFCYDWLRFQNFLDQETGQVKVEELYKYVTDGLEEA